MKHYSKILEANPDVPVIEHEWGQTPATILELINQSTMPVFLLSRIKLGLPSIRKLLEAQDAFYDVVGKGEKNARLLHIESVGKAAALKPIGRQANFTYADEEFNVTIGEAVFSKEGLDKGTRFLLDVAEKTSLVQDGASITDLGCGWGAISLVLNRLHKNLDITAVEKEPGSFNAAVVNLEHLSIYVLHDDVISDSTKSLEAVLKPQDLVIANPPFHVSEKEREEFIKTAKKLLKRDGTYLFVTEGSFRDRSLNLANKIFRAVKEHRQDRYLVLECSSVK